MPIKTINDIINRYSVLKTQPRGTSTYTPFPLVKMMTDDVTVHLNLTDPGLRLLDPVFGYGNFLLYLKIILREFHEEEYVLRHMLYGVETNPFRCELLRREGFKNIYNCDFLSWESDMRFDAIVGNFPFQSNNGSGIIAGSGPKPSWAEIVDVCISAHLKDGGVMNVITPDNIFSSSNKEYSQFKGSNMKFDVKKIITTDNFFPHISQKTVAWMMHKAPYLGSTNCNGIELNLSKLAVLPITSEELNLKILKKIQEKSEKSNDKLNFSTANQINPINATSNKTAKNKYAINANGTVKYISTKSDIYNTPKVLIAQLKKWQDSCMYSDSMSNSPSTLRMIVKNSIEGKNLINLLNSKLYTFYCDKMTRVAGRITWAINTLPLLDLSRTWTDREIYECFELDPIEISHIESMVK